MNRRRLIACVLVVLLVCSVSGVGLANPRQPKIVWASDVAVEITRGEQTAFDLGFVSSADIEEAHLWVVPELRSLVTLSETSLYGVKAHEPRGAMMTVGAPHDAPLGVREGTVHLRVNGATIPKPLKVMVTVNESEQTSFFGKASVSPDVIFVDVPTEVTVAVVAHGAQDDGSSLELVRTDSHSGHEVALGALYDDGTNGDDLAYDNIFHGRFTFEEASFGTVNLAVRRTATDGTTVYSEPFVIHVRRPLEDGEWEQMGALRDGARERFRTLVSEETTEAALHAVASWLSEQELVEAAFANDQGVGITFTNGIEASMPIRVPGALSGAASYLSGAEAATGGTLIAPARTLMLTPFEFEVGAVGLDSIARSIERLPSGSVHRVTNDAADVEAFKRLSDYGVVIIATHGCAILPGEYGLRHSSPPPHCLRIPSSTGATCWLSVSRSQGR